MLGDELGQAISKSGVVMLFAGVKEKPVLMRWLDAKRDQSNLYLE